VVDALALGGSHSRKLSAPDDRRQVWMLDGVKLAPSRDGHDDKGNPGGNSEAKTDIDEGQQAGLRDHQTLKYFVVPGIGDAGAICASSNESGKVS
jgi:hypothetical protein